MKEKGDKTHVDTTEYDFGTERMSISTKCKDPELAIQYCDFWFTDQGIQLANYGVEGLSCEVVDGKPQFTDTVLNNPRSGCRRRDLLLHWPEQHSLLVLQLQAAGLLQRG